MPSKHHILCRPLFLLPSIFSSTRVFSSELALHIRWPKHWSFSFSISPSSEYSGLISFRIDWFDLLAVQGTPKTVLQHHNLKASVLQCSASHIGTWLLEKPCEVKITQSRPSLQPHGLYSPWNSPGRNTGVGSHSLLQGIFPTQGSNPGLLHCRQILYQLSHQGSPGKTIALTIWTFVSKVVSLLFNMPAKSVIDFLPDRRIN